MIYAFLESAEFRKVEQQWMAIIRYYNDSDPNFKAFDEKVIDTWDEEVIRAFADGRVKEFEAQQINPSGVKSIISLVGSVLVAPDGGPGGGGTEPEDPAKTAWKQKVSYLQQIQFLSPDHAFRVQLQSDVDSTFDPAFIGFTK